MFHVEHQGPGEGVRQGGRGGILKV
jgi:hypothetical protein